MQNHVVIGSWLRDIARYKGEFQRRYSGGSVRVTADGTLIYERKRAQRRSPWGPVTLAVYLKDRDLIVINGDGFTDPRATEWQTFLRVVVQAYTERNVEIITQDRRRVPWGQWSVEGDGEMSVQARALGRNHDELVNIPFRESCTQMLVPFAALSGAEIEVTSLRPLEVTADTWENVWHTVPSLLVRDEKLQKRINATGKQAIQPTREYGPDRAGVNRMRDYVITQDGQQWSFTARLTDLWQERVHGKATRRLTYDPTVGGRQTYYQERGYTYRKTTEWMVQGQPTVRGVDIEGRTQQREVLERSRTRRRVNSRLIILNPDGTEKRRIEREDDVVDWQGGGGHADEQFGWMEERHHLGAALFSGVGEDGRRHKFVSAFDADEPQPMYFLAQLPDRSKAETVEQAIHDLAPPIVHAARAQGKRVFRQGDVFAIESGLTDEQVYGSAVTRVRRDVVLAEMSSHRFRDTIWDAIQNQERINWPMPTEDEVIDEVPCVCCEGTMRIGAGPNARAALSIYRTGHTASEVVVGKRGVTYVRGTMHHDPFIETPGRYREHVEVVLGNRDDEGDRKWYVCVRNTVPRRKQRRNEESTNQEGGDS